MERTSCPKRLEIYTQMNNSFTLPAVDSYTREVLRELGLLTGAGIAQWLERRTRDWKVAGLNPLQERRENFILNGQLSVLTLISEVKWHGVTWCMVLWCTENAPRRQQFHVAPAMPALYVHHFGGYSKQRYKNIKKIKTSHSCRIACERSESARERTIALYI